jgi:hypothetical protein
MFHGCGHAAPNTNMSACSFVRLPQPEVHPFVHPSVCLVAPTRLRPTPAPRVLSIDPAGASAPLLRPPSSSAGLPSWLLPAAVVLAGSDAASYFIDPALPLVAAAAAGSIAVSGVNPGSVCVSLEVVSSQGGACLFGL